MWMDHWRTFRDTENKEWLHWKEEESDDIDMLISNGENKGSKLMCGTGPLRQGKEYRGGISQLTRQHCNRGKENYEKSRKYCGEIRMIRKETVVIKTMKFHARKEVLFNQVSNLAKSKERRFSNSLLKCLLTIPIGKPFQFICSAEAAQLARSHRQT